MKKYVLIMQKLLPIVFGTIVSLILWNILMSEFIDRNPLRYFDETLGSRARPNELYINSSEGYARLRMDRYGFNNDDKEVKESSRNIIFLGDSFTDATQLGREKNFTSLVGQKLKENGYDYSAYNLGVSGDSMADYIYYAKGYLDTFSPGIVVVQFNETDFIPNDSRNFENKVVETAGGDFEIRHAPKGDGGWVNALARSSGWMHPIVMRLVEHIALSKQDVTQNGTVPESYQPTLDDVTLTKEDITPTIIWQMNALKRAYGDRLILLYLSDLPVMENGYLRLENSKNVALEREVIFDIAKEEDIPLVDSEKYFLAFYKRTGQLPRGFQNLQPGRGHLNEYGHEIVSDLISREILNQLHQR